ncbi:hypothetical protein DVH26_31785 [Paenibacillus sp. H1-7]|nr:hypothetical protein DVH26_31785 [Paenibacillus sp. H1-7]
MLAFQVQIMVYCKSGVARAAMETSKQDGFSEHAGHPLNGKKEMLAWTNAMWYITKRCCESGMRGSKASKMIEKKACKESTRCAILHSCPLLKRMRKKETIVL